MSKEVERQCPQCGETKAFRADQLTCGCKKPGTSETSELAGDDWTITLPKTRIHTLDQLIEYFEVDTKIWMVDRFICNKWEIGAKEGPKSAGKNPPIKVTPLFQVKAFLKRKKDVVAALKEIEELRVLAKENARKDWGVKAKRQGPATGNMLELNITDHHFGKLAWGVETGHGNYDTKIASALFKKAFNTLLARTSNYQYDEVWFVVGNDILNSDNAESTTTKGTQVCTDVRYHKTFAVVRTDVIECIEKLRTVAPKVRVVMVSGNHDRLSVWHLGDSITSYFHDCPDVVVDNEPCNFKYAQWGRVMLMWTHGDLGKNQDYPLLMATERPEMFGSSIWREAHIGHWHQLKVQEQHGVRVRVLSALTQPDAWHATRGFLGNILSSEAFQWNKDEGLLGTAIFTNQEEVR